MYDSYRVTAVLSENISKSGKKYFQVAVQPYDYGTGKTLPSGLTVMFEKPEIGQDVLPTVRLNFDNNKFVFSGFKLI